MNLPLQSPSTFYSVVIFSWWVFHHGISLSVKRKIPSKKFIFLTFQLTKNFHYWKRKNNFYLKIFFKKLQLHFENKIFPIAFLHQVLTFFDANQTIYPTLQKIHPEPKCPHNSFSCFYFTKIQIIWSNLTRIPSIPNKKKVMLLISSLINLPRLLINSLAL